MSSRRTRALVAIAGIALAHPRPAHADERVRLAWRAPPECSEAEFHTALARHLGRRSDDGPPLHVTIAVHRRDPARWELDLGITATDARGARHLTASSCLTLVDAAAFIVSQALADAAPPELVPEAPPPADVTPPDIAPPTPTVAPTADVVTPPMVAVAPDAAAPPVVPTPVVPPRRPGLRGAVRVGGGVRHGALPGASPGLALTLGLLGRRWRVDLVGRGDLPTVARSSTTPSVAAKISLWAVGARGCGVPGWARLEFPLCAGVELGQVIGRGVDGSADGRAALVWAAATINPGLAWSPRPWIALVFQVDVAISLVRHDFVVRGLPPLHRVGPLQAGASLGVEWRFGGTRP